MKLEKKIFNQNKYNELIDYANKNNKIIVDKGTYYETEEKKEPVKTLEELKEEKIKQLEKNCEDYIFSVYSVAKQLNIINPLNDYTEEDKQNMNIFINKNRNICKEKKELIKKAKNQKELEEIGIKF